MNAKDFTDEQTERFSNFNKPNVLHMDIHAPTNDPDRQDFLHRELVFAHCNKPANELIAIALTNLANTFGLDILKQTCVNELNMLDREKALKKES